MHILNLQFDSKYRAIYIKIRHHALNNAFILVNYFVLKNCRRA